MCLSQVRYFLVLAEELNFTRAAEKCNVSQPTMTRPIKALEEAFSTLLFHREGAHTYLTEFGRLMSSRA